MTVGGVVLAAGSGGQASLLGDGMVLFSSVLATLYVITQASVSAQQRAVAVTAVQMLAASLATLPLAVLSGPVRMPSQAAPVLALVGLVVIGSLVPFILYAWARPRVTDAVAGAFFNVETLVAMLAGALAFHNPMDLRQALGMAVILGGVAVVSAPRGRDVPKATLGEASLVR